MKKNTKLAPVEVLKCAAKTVNVKPRILRVFLNADLRGSHDYLILTAGKYGVDLKSILPNQVVVFVNRRQTMMKCFVAGNTISHTKRDHIDLKVIEALPNYFGAKEGLDYDKALAEALLDRLS